MSICPRVHFTSRWISAKPDRLPSGPTGMKSQSSSVPVLSWKAVTSTLVAGRYLCSLVWVPAGTIWNRPPRDPSRIAANVDGDGNSGRQHQSIDPLRPTSAAVRMSPITAYAEIGGYAEVGAEDHAAGALLLADVAPAIAPPVALCEGCSAGIDVAVMISRRQANPAGRGFRGECPRKIARLSLRPVRPLERLSHAETPAMHESHLHPSRRRRQTKSMHRATRRPARELFPAQHRPWSDSRWPGR